MNPIYFYLALYGLIVFSAALGSLITFTCLKTEGRIRFRRNSRRYRTHTERSFYYR